MTNIAIENCPVEIVSFPMKHGGSFHIVTLVYQNSFSDDPNDSPIIYDWYLLILCKTIINYYINNKYY